MSRPRTILGFMLGAAVGWNSTSYAQDLGIERSVRPLIKTKHSRPKPADAPCPIICPPLGLPACPPVGDPNAPGLPVAPNGLNPPIRPVEPGVPFNPNAPATPTNLTAALTGAEAGGTSARATALPQVFGDLIGGGFLAGPLPVVINPNGQIASPLPIIVLPNGQRQLLLGGGRVPPTDELLLGRSAPTRDPNARTVAVYPGEGNVFDPSLADFVSRVPQFVRGAFKISENDTPRPTTRAYFTYNFYDQVGNTISGPDTPRIMLHQETFGYEQALGGDSYSVGIRLPYNQLVSNSFLNDTSLGDITLTSKFLLRESATTGSVLSAGLLLTLPTGNLPFNSTLSGQGVRGVLFQPYVGYIVTNESGRAFVQGFSSLIIPSDSNDVTFMANSVNVGYKLLEFETGRLASIVPVGEFHLNTPFNHRGTRSDPVGFVDSLTMLGGTHFLFRSGAGLGFAVGAPVTGPRPFSLQATVQANFRF